MTSPELIARYGTPVQWRSLDLSERALEASKDRLLLGLPWVNVMSVRTEEGRHEANICQIVMNELTVPEGSEYPSGMCRGGVEEALQAHLSALEEILLYSVRDDGSASRPRCMDGLLALQSKRRSPFRMGDLSVGWLLRPSLRRRVVVGEGGERDDGFLVLSELTLLATRCHD